MRKKTNKNINLTLPATISDFSQDTENEQFSRAKLKVCHNQETVDHRYFTDKCRENLFKSLPYTPIVSCFDEKADDFKGHAVEQQIFGIVDPCRDYTFETDEQGQEWCVCDVVLYTERPDSVGKIAQKIVGHSHSLELDPNSVKYEILYDEKKHFKRIEFTEAKFIGLSVLGEKQKPAFSGSVFFNYDESFEAKMKLLKDYCESNKEGEEEQKMDYKDFMQLSYGEISTKLDQGLNKLYSNDGFAWIRDIYSDRVVFTLHYFTSNETKMLMANYSVSENGEINFDENTIQEVRVAYEPVAVITTEEASTIAEVDETAVDAAASNDEEEEKKEEISCKTSGEEEEDEKEEEISCEVEEEEDKEEETSYETPEEKDDDDDNDDKTSCETITETEDNDFTAENQEEVSETTNEQESVQEESNSTAFSESERAEFEALKREKKVNLLDSYKDYLLEEEYNTFFANLDNYENDELELELLKKYKAVNSQKIDEVSNKVNRAFAYNSILNHNNIKDEDPIADFIKQSKNKRR